jgi:hypothetical protein
MAATAKKGILEKEKTDINKALLENFVSLQRVLTNLSLRFDTLSDKIEKLLQLFEISAKSFIEKHGDKSFEKDKELLDKLNNLGEQNKVIAKGLTLLEQKLRERVYGEGILSEKLSSETTEEQNSGFKPKPLPRF